MNAIRLIFPLLATIGLLFSTSLAAYSQGLMAGSHAITICSPDGAHEILLGANGDPVSSDHECDDCCFISIEASDVPIFGTTGSGDLVQSVEQMTEFDWLSRVFSNTNARSPPQLV